MAVLRISDLPKVGNCPGKVGILPGKVGNLPAKVGNLPFRDLANLGPKVRNLLNFRPKVGNLIPPRRISYLGRKFDQNYLRSGI